MRLLGVSSIISMEYNRVYQGDARNMRMIESDSVDLIVTSPPYNVSVDYENYDDELKEDDYYKFISDCFSEFQRVLSDKGRICINISLKNKEELVDTPRKIKEIAAEFGWDLRFEIVWDKGDSESSSAWGSWRSPSSPRPILNHEYIFVFDVFSEKRKYEKSIEKELFMQLVKSVWRIKPETNSEHPAAFPIEVPKRLIELNSYEGEVVLDPFVGSGTTAVAAQNLNRKWIGVDLSEEYIQMCHDRINDYPEQTKEDVKDRSIFDY